MFFCFRVSAKFSDLVSVSFFEFVSFVCSACTKSFESTILFISEKYQQYLLRERERERERREIRDAEGKVRKKGEREEGWRWRARESVCQRT